MSFSSPYAKGHITDVNRLSVFSLSQQTLFECFNVDFGLGHYIMLDHAGKYGSDNRC